jgi:UDP-glucose 4-epimerase
VRVLITGVGGELGTRVALALSADRRVKALAGLDLTPPRLRLPSLAFTEVEPRDRRRVLAAVRAFAPTAIVHLGVYEPDAWSSPRIAGERTSANTLTVLGAAADLGSLDRIVVRSGIEVYGRARRAPSMPDESVPPNPTTAFARSLLEVERLAADAGEAGGVPVAVLRVAPIVGPRVASPTARYLRLPIVPVSALADPTFSVLHVDDAAAAMLAALWQSADDTVNVVGPGAVSVWQASRLGGRIPIPLIGPEWRLVRPIAEMAGAPLPNHVLELIHRGRTADGARAPRVLGIAPARSTRDAVTELQLGVGAELDVVEGAAA